MSMLLYVCNKFVYEISQKYEYSSVSFSSNVVKWILMPWRIPDDKNVGIYYKVTKGIHISEPNSKNFNQTIKCLEWKL